MNVRVAESAGFCYGVKRAINMAEECGKSGEGNKATLGPIIHNPQVVERLEENGIFAVDSHEDIDDGTVIIRSHGVKLQDLNDVKDRGLNVVDATCPFVKKSQALVSLMTEKGYPVLVVGERDHPEVKGLLSYGDERIQVVDSVKDVSDLTLGKRVGLVAQTTIRLELFQEVVSLLLERCSEVLAYNTICDATSVRQEDTSALAEESECMVVVGGKNSGNTRRLAEICASIQPNTHHIETAAELKDEWFEGVTNVGVTAGASTPDWIIDEVVERIDKVGRSVA